MNASTAEVVTLTPSMVPNDANVDIKDSSFFQRWSQLPSPAEVRSKARDQHLAGVNPDKRKHFALEGPNSIPPPVVFESLGLFVKWGSDVRISEGQSLYAVHRFLEGAVPVPEVYGWRMDGGETFIYMQLLTGKTLEEVWEVLSADDRSRICGELRSIFDNLTRFKQDPMDCFIGNISRGPLLDRILEVYESEAGPFSTVKDFHDWFTFLCRRRMADPYSVPIEPYRWGLPDDINIKFTHGDLHRSNIMLTPFQNVLAIVDWEQSGWFPAYWEERKAHYTADWKGKWSRIYLPTILNQYPDTWEPWDYYRSSLGC